MREESGTFQELRPAGHAVPGGDGAASAPPAEIAAMLEAEPRDAGEILDAALEIGRGRFGLFVLVSSGIWLLSRGLQPFIGPHVMQRLMEDGEIFQGFLLNLANIGVTFAVGQLALSCVALLAWPALEGRAVSTGAVARRALARLAGVFVIQLVASLAYGVGFVCCIAPGIYLYWKLSLAALVYVLEPVGFFGSFARSFQLTSHNETTAEAFFGFLRWFAVVLTAGAANAAFAMVGGLGEQPWAREAVLAHSGIPEWVFDAVLVGASSLLNGVGSALTSLAMLAYYLDCRVRRDGLDLKKRLKELAAPWTAARDATADEAPA